VCPSSNILQSKDKEKEGDDQMAGVGSAR